MANLPKKPSDAHDEPTQEDKKWARRVLAGGAATLALLAPLGLNQILKPPVQPDPLAEKKPRDRIDLRDAGDGNKESKPVEQTIIQDAAEKQALIAALKELIRIADFIGEYSKTYDDIATLIENRQDETSKKLAQEIWPLHNLTNRWSNIAYNDIKTGANDVLDSLSKDSNKPNKSYNRNINHFLKLAEENSALPRGIPPLSLYGEGLVHPGDFSWMRPYPPELLARGMEILEKTNDPKAIAGDYNKKFAEMDNKLRQNFQLVAQELAKYKYIEPPEKNFQNQGTSK